MMPAPIPQNESARLAALKRYEILDTPAEVEFDDLTRLAAQICGVPIALVSLVDANRQWFKSKLGLEAAETPRDISFCGHSILGQEVFEVPDALADARFRDNPLVASNPNIRFYAGAPLRTPDGHAVGTLCVIDRVARQLTTEQREGLVRLGRQAAAQMELRLTNRRLAQQIAFQESVLANAASAIIAITPEGVITHFNPAAEQMLGYTAEEMIGKRTPGVLHDPADVAARAPGLSAERGHEIAPGFGGFVAKGRAGRAETREWTYTRKDGCAIPVEYTSRPMRDEEGQIFGAIVVFRDITERKQAELRESNRNWILEAITSGMPLAGILERIVRAVEAEDPGAIASVLLLDLEEKHLLLGAAPNLPDFYNQAIHGLAIGPAVGSCGTAAFTKARVIAADLLTHPNWTAFREIVLKVNLRSCWSEPILSSAGAVLGTFAIYHRTPGEPGSAELERIKTSADLARLAIERSRATEEIRALNAGLEQKVAERTASLAASEERFRAVAEGLGEGLLLTDLDDRVLDVNPRMLEITGFSRTAFLGQIACEVLTPADDREKLRARNRDRALGKSETYTTDFLRQDGKRFWATVTASPLRAPDGQVIGTIRAVTDVTERKRAEELVIENNRALCEFKAALDSHAIVATTDERGKITYANDKFCAISKYAREELLGQDHRIINSGHHGKEFFRDLWATITNGRTWKGEIKNRAKDGSIYWVDTTIVPFVGPDGKPAQFIAIRADITERKRSEFALHESEERLRLALEAAQMGSYDWDIPRNRIVWSRQHEALWGYKPGEFGGTYEAFSERVHPDDLPGLNAAIALDIRNKDSFRREFRVVWPDRSEHWIESSGEFMFDEAGKAVRMRGAVLEITERKCAQEELDRFFMLSLDMMGVASADGFFKRVSPGFTLTLGWSVEEMLAQPFMEFIHPDDRAPTLHEVERLVVAGEKMLGFENRYLHKTGSWRVISWKASPQPGGLMYFTGRDVTDLKAAEVALRLRTRMAEFQARIGQAIAEHNELRPLLQVCAASIQKAFDAAFARIWTLNEAGQMLELQASAGQYTHLDGPHGRVPLGKFKIGLIASERLPHLTNQVLGDPRVGDQEWAQREGMVAFAGYPLIADGKLVGVVAMFARHPFSDSVLEVLAAVANTLALGILARQTESELRQANQTERKALADLSRANAELAQASKLKDEFLANMSHELRTPLNAILGLSEALLENTAGTLTARQLKSITTIATSGAHLLALINDILDLSKIEAGKFELNFATVQMAEFCESCLVFVRTQAMQKKLGVAFELGAQAPAQLSADPKRLKQILVNLLTNAVKFTPQGGHIGLSVTAPAGGNAVCFTVWDTGIGIAQADQAKLFHAFTQVDSGLNRAQEGTGLGLALVAKLAEVHGGSVSLESELGKGSRFTVTLPASAGGEPSPVTPLPARRALIVDDDAKGGGLLAARLVELGFRSTLLSSGEGVVPAALEVRPHVILLDICLPGESGWDVLKKLKAHPSLHEIPVVVESAVDEPEKSLALGAAAHLTKPIFNDHFTEVIRSIFPGEASSALADQVQQAARGQANFRRALVIEDDPTAGEQLVRYLTELGLESALHVRGEESIQAVLREKPDVILLDILLPGESGWVVLTKLKEHPGTRDIPVAVVSVVDEPKKSLSIGAAAHFTKPISREQLAGFLKVPYLPKLEPAPSAASPPAGPSILLAEDNEANVQTIGGYLEDKGYTMIYAANGAVAVKLTRDLSPALILMDIQMPVMDGLMAIKEIRSEAALKNTPIIALTALAMPGDRERCLAMGATEYMSKPVGLKKLADLIEQLLRNRKTTPL